MTKSFHNIYNQNPVKYNKVLDVVKNKFPMDAKIFGKPNVIINSTRIDDFGQQISKALNKFDPNELVELAETFSSQTPENEIMNHSLFFKILNKVQSSSQKISPNSI